MNLFNNREIATVIWLLVALIFALSKRTIRESMLNVVKAFFHSKILLCVGFMILYTIGIVAVLYAANLWNAALLKDTVFWFCFAAMVLVINFVTSKSNENVFWKVVGDNVKVVIIIEFLVNTYTFSLAGELLIIPLLTFIVMIDAVARTDEKYSAVAKLTTGLQIIIGLTILLFAIFKAASDYENLRSMDTIRSLLLLPVLSILFSPFIYFMLLFSNYELLFIRLNFGPEKDEALKRYAKLQIIWHCRLSLKRIREFMSANALNLMKIGSRDDVDNMLKSCKIQY